MNRPYQPCKRPGCPELTRNKSGYCDAHQSEYKPRDYKRENYSRDKSTKGIYNDQRYIRARRAKLRMNPLCEDCEKEGIVTVATETHHKKKVRDYLALAFSVSNLMSLCESHHSIRTNRGE